MEFGAITQYVDVAQIVLYMFWAFFAGLIYYLVRENHREGYPMDSGRENGPHMEGWPPVPESKTYKHHDGHETYSPDLNKPDGTYHAQAAHGWIGAPLDPVGNPLLAGVGPGAWAARADVPDMTWHGEAKIVPLRVAHDHGIAARDTDPRGLPVLGVANWENGWLPSLFQGTAVRAKEPRILNLDTPPHLRGAAQENYLSFLDQLNRDHLREHPGETDLSARIASYELAAKMQLAAAEIGDLGTEPAHVLKMYGADDTANANKAGFAKNCILARRLVESGVRFVQLFNGSYAMGEGVGNWDGHKKIADQYKVHAPILDQPCAALLRDLRERGLLADTLVAFVTEFGRMPTFQKGANGRDHNPKGFTVWLAGAGVKRGFSYGATDEFGYKAVENVTTIYDLHATMLHLIGLNHERLSFYNNGVERRLTDVHGHVVKDVLA